MECNKYHIPTDKKLRVAMIGIPSSGKDTVCDALSAAVSNSNQKAHEEARIYIEKHGPIKSPFQQLRILDLCKRREDEALNVYQIVWCPGGRLLAYFYTALFTPKDYNTAELDNLLCIYEDCIKSIKDYDYIFYCNPLPYDRDGLRIQTAEDNLILDAAIKSFFAMHKVDYVTLEPSSVEERCHTVLEVLGAQKIEGEAQ